MSHVLHRYSEHQHRGQLAGAGGGRRPAAAEKGPEGAPLCALGLGSSAAPLPHFHRKRHEPDPQPGGDLRRLSGAGAGGPGILPACGAYHHHQSRLRGPGDRSDRADGGPGPALGSGGHHRMADGLGGHGHLCPVQLPVPAAPGPDGGEATTECLRMR